MDNLLRLHRPAPRGDEPIPLQDHDVLAQSQDNPEDDDSILPCTEPQRNDPPPQHPDRTRRDPGKRKALSQDVPRNIPAKIPDDHPEDYCGVMAECWTPEGNGPAGRGQDQWNLAQTPRAEGAYDIHQAGDDRWHSRSCPVNESDVVGAQPSPGVGSQLSRPPRPLEGHLPVQSQPSALPPPRNYRENVTATSSHVIEMTSPYNTAVVVRARLGEGPGLTSEDRGPHMMLVVLNTIVAFLSLFCCLCTGIAAFVVAIEVVRKKKAGQRQKARERLWCSLFLSIASFFFVLPTLLLLLLPTWAVILNRLGSLNRN